MQRKYSLSTVFQPTGSLEIAKRYPNVTILQNKWVNNYAYQFNWGLENAPITGKWVLRLDADEYLLPELIEEIKEKLPDMPEIYPESRSTAATYSWTGG